MWNSWKKKLKLRVGKMIDKMLGFLHIDVSQEEKGVDHEIAGGMPVSVGRCAFFGGTTLIPQ